MRCTRCGMENLSDARFCEKCGAALSSGAAGSLQAAAQAGKTLLGRYRIESRLGGGSMGAVYRAWDIRLEKFWALKEVTITSGTPEEKDEILSRFKREAKILSKLDHHNLPTVVDYFSEGGNHYLVMDLVEGEDLETWAEKPGKPGLPAAEVIDVALVILDVLDYLHRQAPPVLYRDLKPSNIMRQASDGTLFLVDFGIAKTIQAQEKRTGTAIGTEGYAPPEQYEGKCDPRSDLYALGATMHHLLTGQYPLVPFQFAPVPGIPADLQALLDRVLSRNAPDRYSSAAEMKKALLQVGASKGVNGAPPPVQAPRQIQALPPAQAPPQAQAPPLQAPSASLKSPPSPQKPGSQGTRPSLGKGLLMSIAAVILLCAIVAFGFAFVKQAGPKLAVLLKLKLPPSSPPGISVSMPRWEKEVKDTVTGAMDSMEKRDLEGHMSFYADRLDTYFSRKDCSWDFVRSDKERAIQHYHSIKITISNLTIHRVNDTTAKALFDKEWDCRNGKAFSGKEKQRLIFRKIDGSWKITSEEELEVYWVNHG
ncbi:MAG: serine/threonine-protein kinase [Candidatus Eremiobacteraeota bacterium]|nr:serine/threonine-protein kinase [Candidatus Eremiobacteraeota bacterium]